MSKLPDVLWLNTSSSLQCFDQPLLRHLSLQVKVAQWEYSQTQDEASCLDVGVFLLHDYLKSCDRPLHLIGHSTGGLLGLLYARQYPERVKSLTLLAVGSNAAINWQAQYYAHLQLLSRQKILTSMVYNLFGYHHENTVKRLARILEQDLDCSLSPHSLLRIHSLPPGGVSVPLMVCGSNDDIVVGNDALQGWRPYLKECDRLWLCPQGRHFFHYFYPRKVGRQILKFWEYLYPPVPQSAPTPTKIYTPQDGLELV